MYGFFSIHSKYLIQESSYSPETNSHPVMGGCLWINTPASQPRDRNMRHTLHPIDFPTRTEPTVAYSGNLLIHALLSSSLSFLPHISSPLPVGASPPPKYTTLLKHLSGLPLEKQGNPQWLLFLIWYRWHNIFFKRVNEIHAQC